jgi:CRISPR/Cas system CSM-associated protein Csm3 (group 7 of RAMP superfamily)
MPTRSLDIHLTLLPESPLHIGTGYGHAGYLDAVMTTDARGYPYVPGSSLKGRLRYYLSRLLPALAPDANSDTLQTTLFGSKEHTGGLFFDNLHLTEKWAALVEEALADSSALGLARGNAPVLSQRQTNVMLSRLRGVAMERRLFTVESAPAHLAFSGRIHGIVEDKVQIGGYPRTVCLLVAAIGACTHLGGRKSRGLGRCHLQIDRLTLDGTAHNHDTLLEALA